jgi:Domain of unknown function (DUF6438)
MKTILFALTLLLLPFVAAGELATLHQQLAPKTTQDTGQTPEKSDSNLPEGMALAPGVTSLGGSMLDRSKHGIDEIGLERTRCLTNCPAYTVIINTDGTFRYTGEYGVEHMGEHTGKVSIGELNQVMSFIAESLFSGFEDTYSSNFLDAPTTYVMVKTGSETKVIENYGNTGPATLWAIEHLIDDLLETAEWDAGGGAQ